MIDVSIIIVSFNAREHLLRCLESLHAVAPLRSREVIVVDNGSADGSPEAAARWADVQVISSGRNRGFAQATNIGIRASSGTNLLLLNSDTVVPAGAVERLLNILERHPETAVIGPRLVDRAGTPELSFGRMIGPLNELRQKLRSRSEIDRLTGQTHYPDWVSGACLLVRRDDAMAVGLLDERYFMYTEDVDFCAAIRARNRRILFTPDVEVVHLRGRSAASSPKATYDAYRRSQVEFYRKHHPHWVPLLKLYLRITADWRRQADLPDLPPT
jgi:GT2 family glycosyltransferase